jgi:phosphoglycerol transferase MdoB-like AlkP superfamily enzyme
MTLRIRALFQRQNENRLWDKFNQAGKYIDKINKYLPRSETIIIFIGLICTVLAKAVILKIRGPQALSRGFIYVVFPDVIFFVAVFSSICILYVISPSLWMSRIALLISMPVLLWSILNAGWLIESGIQLQPSILTVLFRGVEQIWPILQTHIITKIYQTILLGLVIVLLFVFFLWRFLRPAAIDTGRFRHSLYVASSIFVIIILILAKPVPPANLGLLGDVLGFSSHWYSLNDIFKNRSNRHIPMQLRNIPQAGQRKVSLPSRQNENPPNVVIVLLESTHFSISQLDKPCSEYMPVLRQIAEQSVEFRNTMVILPYTTKAFWSVLTSTTPNTQPDYIEAIPADHPYESLASILARVGYRSAFFEMSKGGFECAPGLFANLAFDWAWFRENLNDPLAYLAPLSGDDCRMIEPALKWSMNSNRPFLLMMITSVSHDPYKVPMWFSEYKQDPYERYLQTIRYTDYFLGKLCKALKENSLEDNTILCILGDHGTSFRSKMGNGRWIPYDEVIRVPWLIRWPGHLQAGRRIDWLCSQLDVTPTILNLAGFDVSRSGFEGKDAFAPSNPNRRLYFSSWYSNSPAGFIEGKKKIVYWPSLDKVFEYDLSADPNEENPKTVAAQEKAEFKDDILKWLGETQISIDPKRHTEHFIYSHWQIFTAGRTGWAYYVQ